MNITCSQKKLINALSIASKAVATNNTLPVLNNVLLKAEGKYLHLTSTNLELAIHHFIEADIKNEGSITLPAKLISSYVGYLKDGDVNLELKEDLSVSIKSGQSKTKIKGLDSTEFPSIPKVDKEGSFEVRVIDFQKAVNQVVFAAAINTTRPILTGVYFCMEEGKLKMVATDSYRLSENKISVDQVEGEVSCIIPVKTIIELGSVLSGLKEVEKIEVRVSKNQIMFKVGRVELTSRLIEGQFPNYKPVIPQGVVTKVKVGISDLSLVLKRIGLFAKENNNKILLDISSNTLKVTTETTQYGVGEEELMVHVEGEGGKIALNSQFILDVIGGMEGEEVEIGLENPAKPAVFKMVGKEGYLHIIMPLKI